MAGAAITSESRPAVIPRLITADPAGLVEFIRVVFDARGESHADRPAEIRIGKSVIMVSDGSGLREAATGFLYVYVTDVDAAWRRALAAGARSLEEPAEMPYGDRRAMVEDSWGNTWQIATPRRAPET
ncbi:MAG TPA: VOC family protein [Caulobacteraceae bacterium]